jgi:hypothetical protein
MLYTAQIGYAKKGFKDALDITVMSGQGPFIPTWPMVKAWKAGHLSDAQYTTMYIDMITPKVKELDALAVDATIGDIVLCCYCTPATFCHRILLARHLADNYHVDYMGEITFPNWTKRR